MSMQTPYLTFLLQGGWYAVEASHVREILRLPGLTPVSEAPHYIIGVMNYRGHIVPVMDLAIRLGQSPWAYRIHDHIIVLQLQSVLLGLIVNEVQGVHEILIDTRGTPVPFAGSPAHRSQLVRHLAKLDTTAIMVVDHDLLLNPVAEFQTDANQAARTLSPVHWQQSPEHTPPGDGIGPSAGEAMPLFFQHAAPWEREVLLERARSLASNLEERSASPHIPLAIVGLGGEYFGVELATVREFSDLQRITPVPCCPSFIVGDMNLRGDILTVVDIRQGLQMPVVEAVPTAKVMVVPLGDALVGVLVDEVFDVFDVDPAALTPVPSAIKSINDTCLKGTVSYYGKIVAILDLQKILTTGSLMVDEEE
jgi:purine-binding chemotaxis protein CheW